jgi:hypothetical protein
VAVEFLSDDQVAAYCRFAGPPERAELERFFFLDDADRALVARRRGDQNRLGFSLQLGTVRFIGLFPADPLDVPAVVADYLALIPAPTPRRGRDEPHGPSMPARPARDRTFMAVGAGYHNEGLTAVRIGVKKPISKQNS